MKTVPLVFIENIELLLKEARQQRKKYAVSWRRYHVGAAVLAANGKNLRIFGGANLKPKKNGQKVCAEQQAIKHASLAGHESIQGIVVIGKPQQNRTLRPCLECLKLMQRVYRLSGQTPIYCASINENEPGEYFTLQELLKQNGFSASSRNSGCGF